MSALHAIVLIVVAVTGTATVLVRDPPRQLVVAGFFGLALAVLFLAFGAPDVALSQIGVSTVAVPVMGLLTLARMARREEEEEEEDE
jgi:energy-converting hydrogenase B subunit D